VRTRIEFGKAFLSRLIWTPNFDVQLKDDNDAAFVKLSFLSCRNLKALTLSPRDELELEDAPGSTALRASTDRARDVRATLDRLVLRLPDHARPPSRILAGNRRSPAND
jgi:hypothetical protein